MNTTTTKLVDVTLPGLEVSLKDRLKALPRERVNVAVYASNLIPFQLKVTTTGLRSLHVAVFNDSLNPKRVIERIRMIRGFKPAVIEDIIALAEVPSLSFGYPTIVCPGAWLEDMSGGSELTAVHLFLDRALTAMERREAEQRGRDSSAVRVHTLGLTRPGAAFNQRVGFLIVEDLGPSKKWSFPWSSLRRWLRRQRERLNNDPKH